MKTLFLLLAISSLSFLYNTSQAQNALDFDGVNDYVITGYYGIGGTSARTIEAWISTTANTTPSTGGHQIVIADYGTFTTGGRFTFNILYNGSIRIEVGGNGINGTSSINDGSWHHVAVVYNPSATNKYGLYVDGVLENSGNLTVSTNTGNSVPFTIGKRVDGINYFDGKIDEVRVWSTARTATEISSNMNNSFCGTVAGLTAYYKFNQGIAGGSNSGVTTLIDQVNSVNNGVLNNFTLSGSTSNWILGKSLSTGTGTSSTTVITACDSYTSPSGQYTWTSSNTYMDTIPNSTGCDSVMTINLTINNSSADSITEVACYSYTAPSGAVHTSSGTFNDIIPNAAGCDSVISVSLTINNVDITVFQNGNMLTSNTSTASYQWVDCDNSYAIITGATNQSFTPTTTGNYAVIVSENNCTDTSACFQVLIDGIGEPESNSNYTLYPNPSQHNISIDLGELHSQLKYEIYNVTGEKLMENYVSHSHKIEVDIEHLPIGIYSVRISTPSQSSLMKFVKN